MHQTPSELNLPAFLVNFPFTVRNEVINNVLMQTYQNEVYNYDIAYKQFIGLYQKLAGEGIVYILPSAGNFQDQVFVANLGVYLPHLHNAIVLSNFKSEPRIGEDKIGLDFFEKMGYHVIQPDTTLEGEADMKWIRQNIYLAGYGIRTDIASHRWIEEKTGAEVVSIEMADQELYHFDCVFFPLSCYKALVVTTSLKPEDLRKIERYVEVVDIPKKHKYSAYTNSLLLNGKIIYSPVDEEARKDFPDFISKIGYEPVIVELTEFEKSGAGVSCFIMHLNFKSRLIGKFA